MTWSHASVVTLVLEVVFLSAAAASTFVALTYLVAVLLTRGAFGWPGFGYFGREALWVLVTQSLLPIGWVTRGRASRHGPPRLGDGATTRPVVLVHGYTQNRTNFVWLSRELSRRGHGPIFGFDYDTFRPIENGAKRLAAFVDGVLEQTGATEVDLVCHSLGGLVARTYVDLLGGERAVRRIVTLGSPHRGLKQASRLFGAGVVDLHPERGFIARLEASRSKVPVFSIYSSHDNIVFPVSASSLGELGTDVVVHRHGHFGILFSSEVADHVHRALS